MQDSIGADEELMTLDELCKRTGMSVRNVRFYTTRGLVPSPIRRGRSGYYTADHVARLELVAELQAHGFTLAAIERYVARIPGDASPSTIAMHRTLLAPWTAEQPDTMSRRELDARAGRTLSTREVTVLEEFGILKPKGKDRFEVATAHLDAGFKLIQFEYPVAAAVEARKVYVEHARAIADSLNEIFHQQVWPAYRDSGAEPEDLQEAIEMLKPLSIAALVTAYEEAVTESVRERIARRTT